METTDIEETITRNRIASKNFGGVFPVNRVPFKQNRLLDEVFFIINNQPAGYRGQHWLVVRLTRSKHSEPSEFFDPFGYPPSHYNPSITNMLILNGPSFIQNNKHIQDQLSDYCGYYCMLYILYRSMNYSMSNFLEMFSETNFKKNDKLALELVTKHFFS